MIRFVVALPAEARPLVRRFGLNRVAGGEFPVWRAAGTSVVVSGVGRRAAASAVGFLGAGESAAAAWLNVGVGGHRSLPLGTIVLANEVADGAGGKAWCRPPTFAAPCATVSVTTVDRPETGYPEETVYEMEAAGFCAAAGRLVPPQLIQVVKVISDNATEPPSRLTSARVEELIDERIEIIQLIAERTAALARGLDSGS